MMAKYLRMQSVKNSERIEKKNLKHHETECQTYEMTKTIINNRDRSSQFIHFYRLSNYTSNNKRGLHETSFY